MIGTERWELWPRGGEGWELLRLEAELMLGAGEQLGWRRAVDRRGDGGFTLPRESARDLGRRLLDAMPDIPKHDIEGPIWQAAFSGPMRDRLALLAFALAAARGSVDFGPADSKGSV